MAGRLSFQLEMLGLDATIGKLKELNRQLDLITKKAGVLNVGGKVGGVIAPVGSFTGTAAASGAGAAAAASLLVKNQKAALLGTNLSRKEQVGLQKTLEDEMKKALSGLGKVTFEKLSKDFSDVFKKMVSFAVPPSMRAAVVSGEISLKKLGLVAGTLALAFMGLIKAAEHGAETFQKAARLGRDMESTFQLQSAMRAIGISTQATDRMLLQAEFNKRARVTPVEGTNAMIGAARASQFGDVQQMVNMTKEFGLALAGAAANARQMAESAGRNTLITMMWEGVTREFKTMMSQLSSALSPLIVGFLGLTKIIFKFINLILEGINKLEALLWSKGLGPPGQTRIPGGQGMQTPKENVWGNIGFVMGGGGPDKKLTDIVNNTKDIVREIKILGKQIGGVVGGRMLGQVALPGLP